MSNFWYGKRVLLTGHTGFKGTWTSLWLRTLGADVTGLALAPTSQPSFWSVAEGNMASIIGDVRDFETVRRVVDDTKPEIVLHMAAQALVRESYRDPIGTYATNVMGTVNLLQACRDTSLAAIVVITSDKVYENRGQHHVFVERDRLGGHDPYSNSKACAELVTQSFRDSFFMDSVPLATARAGNVIGGGDWSADRLVPDCVRALAVGKPVELRYPQATRPWQHVIEAVAGYLAFAEALAIRPEKTPRALNFGPDPASICPVRQVVETFSNAFGGKPGWRAAPGDHPVEAKVLALSSDSAIAALNWRPLLNVAAALTWTTDWYRAHAEGKDMVSFSIEQIRQYEELARPIPATAG